MPVLKAVCEYKKVKACSIQADVFLPPNPHPPFVLYIHGGALISGNRRYLPGWQRSRLLQAGFAVVSIDYRLAPETMLAEIVKDIQDAISWAKGEGSDIFGYDADRIAVMGSSAGGYLSLLSGTFMDRPKAIVSFYGYGDILGEWYTRPSDYYCRRPLISKEAAENTVGGRQKSSGRNLRYTYYFYCRQQGIWPEAVSGHNPILDRDKLIQYCPVENIASNYPPVLLIHGDQDNDVPFEQSVEMAQALERHGIKNHLMIVKGAGHGFDGDDKNLEVRQLFERVLAFLETHV